ncbi:hypothetical protein ACFL6C_14550, partial [Myxococcota bacterium]
MRFVSCLSLVAAISCSPQEPDDPNGNGDQSGGGDADPSCPQMASEFDLRQLQSHEFPCEDEFIET